jgi:hypothetical protein
MTRSPHSEGRDRRLLDTTLPATDNKQIGPQTDHVYSRRVGLMLYRPI